MPSGTDVYMASRMFAQACGLDPLSIANAATFYVQSKSRPGQGYWMRHTPEGFAVHVGEGCEGERFHGVLECWHSKKMKIEGEDMTTAVATTEQPMVPMGIDFTDEQIKTIADVICVNSKGERAPAGFVQLFLAASRRAGLDPFLKQIWAMEIRGKWTMFVGIEGYRAACFRTGLDAGMDGPDFSDDGITWSPVPFKAKPAFCRVGIWRKGTDKPFVRILRMDQRYNENSEIWRKDAAGQLAKCTEALARRTAFPADLTAFGDDIEVADPETGEPMTRAEVSEGQYRELPETSTSSPDNGAVKPLNLDADREKASKTDAVVATANQNAEKAAAPRRAPRQPKAAPAAPETQEQASDEPPPLQEQYDSAFREQLEAKAKEEQEKAQAEFARRRAAEFAGDAPQEGEVVARPEPPKGEPQSIPNAPESKAKEMSAFWSAAKKFEKDTAKIVAASKEHFGDIPANLEGIRRAQLIHMLETGELPPKEGDGATYDHDADMYYDADGTALCSVCEAEVDEESGQHK